MTTIIKMRNSGIAVFCSFPLFTKEWNQTPFEEHVETVVMIIIKELKISL